MRSAAGPEPHQRGNSAEGVQRVAAKGVRNLNTGLPAMTGRPASDDNGTVTCQINNRSDAVALTSEGVN